MIHSNTSHEISLHDNIKSGVFICSSIFKYAVGTRINNAHRKNQDHEEQLQHNLFVPSDAEKYTRSKTDLLII